MRYVTLIITLLLITACSSHKQLTSQEQSKTRYLHLTDTLLKHDSIHVHDSVFVTQRGDTFFQYKYRTEYRDRLVYQNHTDTIQINDTITKTYVQTEYVEKRQSLFQLITSLLGTLLLCFLSAIAIIFVIHRYIK